MLDSKHNLEDDVGEEKPLHQEKQQKTFSQCSIDFDKPARADHFCYPDNNQDVTNPYSNNAWNNLEGLTSRHPYD